MTYDVSASGNVQYLLGRLYQASINQNLSPTGPDTETYTYDAYGNLISKTVNMAALGGGSYTTQFAYNNQNQPQQITYPSLDSNNPTIAFSYDRLGRLAAVGYPDPNDGIIDPSNPPPAPSQRYAFYQYDLNGRLLNATMNTAPQIQQFMRTYSYNTNGWLTGIADPYLNEQVGYMGADALNYLNGTIANYTVQYNPSANWTTPPLAVYASFAYDNYGRLITEKVHTPTGIALDGWSGSIAAYDANGNIGTLTQGQTSIAYSYATGGTPPVEVSNQVTTLGANVQNSVNFDNVAPSQQSANGWWWGSNNGGPSGTGVTQTQHPPNLAQSLELTGGSLGHYEVFRLNTFLPPTATLTLSWQVLTGAGYGQAIGAAAWFAVLYTAEGETVSVPIMAIPAANSWQPQTAQIPLAAWAATHGGGNVVQVGLELRNQSRTANGSTGPSIFIAAPSLTGSISAPAYQYDRDGNITQAMARSLYVLNYDAVTGLTRSIQIGSSTGNLLNFSYGLDDNRTLKTYQTSGGSPTVLSQALTLTGLDGQPLAERVTTGTNTNVQYYIPGIGGPAAIIADGSPKILLRDHLGSLRVVVDSETAAVDNSFDYLSFGGMIRASNQPEVSRLFTGQDLDQETGLYDFYARLFDPALGRFLATDPVLTSKSPYVYTNNSPISFVDPNGNEAVPFNQQCQAEPDIYIDYPGQGIIGVRIFPSFNAIFPDITFRGDEPASKRYIGAIWPWRKEEEPLPKPLSTGMRREDLYVIAPKIDPTLRTKSEEERARFFYFQDRIEQFIKPELLSDSPSALEGEYTFVVRQDGQPVFKEQPLAGRMPGDTTYIRHSQLAQGGPVWAAGGIYFSNGMVIVTDETGHYRVKTLYLVYASAMLSLLGFSSDNIRLM
jgi:RHS repeat-associated protein